MANLDKTLYLSKTKALDESDQIKAYREEYHHPVIDGKQVLYFTGNSLGLQPKKTRACIEQELTDWAQWGVEGHFYAKNPWYSYHELFTQGAAKLVGALPEEVIMMNGLSVNLHLLLTTFYRPSGNRKKILTEKKAFPSDQYAVESQIKLHGLNPTDVLIEIGPREGEELIQLEDIQAAITDAGEELACVMIGGVNYYTGQLFDMKAIVEAAHEQGAYCGFDLAHAAGNVPLKLHDWNVDFACWCTYKYLNSGPGGISGSYIHEKHAKNTELLRLAGWWGHDKDERFEMEPGFKPIPTAEGWQLSNAPVFAMAPHLPALEQFTEIGMENLRAKSLKLTGVLEEMVEQVSEGLKNGRLEIITPKDPSQRGCQLSIIAHGFGKELFDALTQAGVITDWREPNVIRMAPVPMYNSFNDVYQFACLLEEACHQLS